LHVDAHNAGIFPLEGRSRILGLLSIIVQRTADMTIVSNDALAFHVRRMGGRPFVLPDPIPDFPKSPAKKLAGKFNILFICTFASDEPYDEVLAAARLLGNDVHIYVTGSFRNKGIDISSLPLNLTLTGYIPENEYVQMLQSVDGTIDLTTRDNCLVCGAYESIAAGKPMILSRTPALKSYFNKGTLFTDNTAGDICRCIENLLKKKDQLAKDIVELKHQLRREWTQNASRLKALVF
jgi:glycosyltransferase involved in cell wall biosynthesis